MKDLLLVFCNTEIYPANPPVPSIRRYNSGTTRFDNQPKQSINHMKTIIHFNADGTAHCLWTDAVPLQELGRLEITRGSNIEFNQEKQEWEVRNMENQLLYSNPSRTACLDWEREHLA